jgi:hypothetical protein
MPGFIGMCRFSGRSHDDAYLLLFPAKTMETHFAVCQSEKRIVSAYADIGAGMYLGASLANDYAARENELTIRAFDSKPFRLAVAAVPGAAHSLFMREQL